MKVFRFCIFTFLIFLFVSPVFAKSAKRDKNNLDYEDRDLSLREIRTLIRETNYDEAFKLLTIYIEKNPENFDNAQRLIAIIMDAKKRYADTLNQLVELITNDPDNDEEIYKIIQQLKKIERRPSDASLAYIDNIDKVVTFSHNQKESNRILTASAQYAENNRLVDSVTINTNGFDLYREEYEYKWGKNSEILKETDLIIENLTSTIELYAQELFNNHIDELLLDFDSSVKQSLYPVANNIFQQLKTELSELVSFRQMIYEDGQQLVQLNQRLVELATENQNLENSESEGEMFLENSDASYLPFMVHFIFGDSDLKDSGILPGVDKRYNTIVDSMSQVVFNQIQRNYNAYTNLFKNSVTSTNFTDSGNEILQNLKDFYSLETNITLLKPELYIAQTDFDQETYENPLKEILDLGEYVINIVEIAENVFKINSQVNELARNQETVFGQLETENDNQKKYLLVTSLLDSTAKIGELVGIKSEKQLESFEWAQVYTENKNPEYKWAELSDLYTVYLDKIFDDSSKILNQGWQRITDYYVNAAQLLAKTVSNNNQVIQNYAEGFADKISAENHKNLMGNIQKAYEFEKTLQIAAENDGVKYKYPDIARLLSSYSSSQIEKVISEINGYAGLIRDNYENHEQWKTDEGITNLVNLTNQNFEDLIAQLQELQKQSNYWNDYSQKQISAAAILRVDGDDIFDDAQTYLNREDFEQARKKLRDASEKYAKSFELQSDESLNILCDKRIQELGMKISRLENEKIVREVRDLKTKAKNAYIDGRFDEADKYLAQASARWSVTNSEEDEEIVNLQVFVNTAVNSKTGREVLPSSPQYEEMTQLLNIAYHYYDSGVENRKKGNITESNKDLDNSESSIKQLQQVYPRHQEAALLNLKISKLRDPNKFNETFSQKIESARLMCKNKDKEIKMEGYANLQDYYELDPSYKNLKNILYQAEFDVGIRQTVDNSNVTKAKTLYNDANRLFKAGNLDAANAKISQALALNPDDTASQRLSDNIKIAIGGTKIPLSTEAQMLYSKSYDSFVQNNYEMADFYINRIEKLDRRFMNDDDVKRLKEKIDALR